MAEADVTPEILELILRTSRVKGCSHIYSLAPRGHRVGLYFQQRRATLLAAAIRTRAGRDALKGLRIGIVGGGVSGLTFLLAIKNQGAENAFLYEASDAVIATGENATHRLVHPNYNRWPLLGSMDMFTSLPVLNWYAASADKVISQLRAQLTSNYADVIEDRVRLNHKVDRIVQRRADLTLPIRLTFENQLREDFNIVVIAAGFSKETSSTWGFEDYWTRTGEDFDTDLHKRPCSIYGVGDAALIDAVRCCARKPDDAWLIPLGTIAQLRPVEAITIRKDQTTAISVRPPNFTELETKIQAHEESMRSIAWAMSRNQEKIINGYAKAEEEFYLGCIADIERNKLSLVRFLEDRFKPSTHDATLRPVLIGSLRHAFEPTAAPINKLLLAYLLKTGRISYSLRDKATQSAELDAWSRESVLVRRSKIVICRFGAQKNFPLTGNKRSGSGRLPVPNGIQLTTQPRGSAAAETATESHLVDALSSITGGEYVYFDDMPDPQTQARRGLDQEGATRDTRERNLKILEMFAREHLNASEVTFNSETDRWVILTDLTDEEITDRLLKVGGLDGNFFGAPIVISDEMSTAKGKF